MGVGGRPAVTRNVLEDRQNAALLQALGHGARDGGDFVRIGSIGAIADHGIGAGDRNIRQRQAIDGDAEIGEIGRDQAARSTARPSAQLPVRSYKVAEHRAGRIDRPMRRAQPLHAAALLIDQHGSIGWHRQLPAIPEPSRATCRGLSTFRLKE